MKDRGKSLVTSTTAANMFADYTFSDPSCRKHPSRSPVGICALCLNERLIHLVCSDCGKLRAGSCSCSDDFSITNTELDSVGDIARISFLIENDVGSPKSGFSPISHSTTQSKRFCQEKPEAIVLLKRHNTSQVDNKSCSFWNLKRIFRKKKKSFNEKAHGKVDERGDVWVLDYLSISKTRSGSSFCESESSSNARKKDLNVNKLGSLLEYEGLTSHKLDVFKKLNRSRIAEIEEDYIKVSERSSFMELQIAPKSDFPPVEASLTNREYRTLPVLKGGLVDNLPKPCFEDEHDNAVGFQSNESSFKFRNINQGTRRSKKSMTVWKWVIKPSNEKGNIKTDEIHSCKTPNIHT